MQQKKSTHNFTYSGADAQRIDKVLPELLASIEKHGGVTRSQIKRWIAEGRVQVDGRKVHKAGLIVESGSQVEVDVEPQLEEEFPAYNIKLDILYEDEALLVINKPPDLSMHPGAGNKSKTLVNALVAHCGAEFRRRFNSRPGIIHRLDKNTSGVVVVAKDPETLAAIAAQFFKRTVGRSYSALCISGPRRKQSIDLNDSGRIETQIGRDPKNRLRMTVLEKGGRRAVTNWKVIERMNFAVLLEVSLETGRTHQIRVHMAHAGSPVLGDKVYGNFSSLPGPLLAASEKFGRQALHASRLAFVHPKTTQRMEFTVPPPSDFQFLAKCFRDYGKR